MRERRGERHVTREERGEPKLWYFTCPSPEHAISMTVQDKVGTYHYVIDDAQALRAAADLTKFLQWHEEAKRK